MQVLKVLFELNNYVMKVNNFTISVKWCLKWQCRIFMRARFWKHVKPHQYKDLINGLLNQWRIQGGGGRIGGGPPFFRPIFVFWPIFVIFGRGIEEFGFPAPPPLFHRSWIRLCKLTRKCMTVAGKLIASEYAALLWRKETSDTPYKSELLMFSYST